MRYVPGHGFIEDQTFFKIPTLSKEAIVTSVLVGGSAAAAAVYLYFTTGTSKRKMRIAGVPGLDNLGNTCYANALLQGLSSVPCVVQWLRDIDTSDANVPTAFLDALKDIILKLNSDEPLTYNAGDIVAALYAKGWQIGIGVEHDLHELFNVFLSTSEDELRAIRKNLLKNSLIDIADQYSAEHHVELPAAPLKQVIFQRCAETVKMDAKRRAPFFGLTATQLRCCNNLCGFKKVRYDSCSVISVQIPKTSGRITLEMLLRKYFCMEIIRGATCDECKKTTGKLDSGLFKKQGFSKLPQCLVIRVERGAVMPSGAVFKVSDHVEFGETLDVRDLVFYRNKENEYDRMMNRNKDEDPRTPEVTSRIVGGAGSSQEPTATPLINGRLDTVGLAGSSICTIEGGSFVAEQRENARYRYQLRAVSEHRGIPETGHFVTYRRGLKDQHTWYLTNDDQVTRVPYTTVAACEAYMLYYERIQPSRWNRTSSYSLAPNLPLAPSL